MYLLGYDIGSSGIKACLVNASNGRQAVAARSPEKELEIHAPKQGWAEQDPETWWKHLKLVTQKLLRTGEVERNAIKAIGISYQMHGLVLVDNQQKVLRPSIIWCDGRAVEIGRQAQQELGKEYCHKRLLNSPGNFTASKLRWVKEHEPWIFKKVYKFMLPGDYIGMKLTGEVRTTVSGLSEGILWDYTTGKISKKLLDYYGIPQSLIPEAHPNFGVHGTLSEAAAKELDLPKGIGVTYRAGDQPNNALSLKVMQPGEVASTAGTSGVIYGVTDKALYDAQSRVNTFVHVNHKKDQPRYGVLLCINGTGILNSWLKNRIFGDVTDYDIMNKKAAQIPVGSDGLVILPFGNGPERVLGNKNIGAQISDVHFNRHSEDHIIRAGHEGIAFSLCYGLQIMKQMGMEIDKMRAGAGNMYLSPVFREALCNTSGIPIELYDTDGAWGAAIGAGIGMGVFEHMEEAFQGLKKKDTIEPNPELNESYKNAYEHWKQKLNETINRQE